MKPCRSRTASGYDWGVAAVILARSLPQIAKNQPTRAWHCEQWARRASFSSTGSRCATNVPDGAGAASSFYRSHAVLPSNSTDPPPRPPCREKRHERTEAAVIRLQQWCQLTRVGRKSFKWFQMAVPDGAEPGAAVSVTVPGHGAVTVNVPDGHAAGALVKFPVAVKPMWLRRLKAMLLLQSSMRRWLVCRQVPPHPHPHLVASPPSPRGTLI